MIWVVLTSFPRIKPSSWTTHSINPCFTLYFYLSYFFFTWPFFDKYLLFNNKIYDKNWKNLDKFKKYIKENYKLRTFLLNHKYFYTKKIRYSQTIKNRIIIIRFLNFCILENKDTVCLLMTNKPFRGSYWNDWNILNGQDARLAP